MIILDTNVIRGMRLDSSDVEILRAVVATGTDHVAVPHMAMEELAAQRAGEYLEVHQKAARALRDLRGRSHRTEPKLEEPDAEGVRRMWRERYNFLQVLPPNGDAALEGLYREANCLPPAGTKGDGNKKVKVGARDVVIWLTAVEYAREHPDETVYFVSSNHKDFTKGTGTYPPPMDSDVAELGDRFVHLTNLAELLESLAPKLQVDAADVRGLLKQHTEYVKLRAGSIWRSVTPFDVRTREGDAASAQTWAFPEDVRVRLVAVQDIEAYQLGPNSWVVATARWEFVGLAISKALVQAACTWETRILFPTRTGDEHTPRIIKAHRAVPVEDATAVDWPPLLKGTEYMQRVLDLAKEEGRNPTWLEIMLGVLASLPALQQTPFLPAHQSNYAAYDRLGHVAPHLLTAGLPDEEQPGEETLDDE
ncbi:PIN domain-containing protein [Streptomyces sp. NPDC056460]|uniref:PIN domain-containing protein n=1 Tax=Streptomyces sp. NPDC056460 TaxID=3345825 RepID=UPI0036CC36FB